MLTRLIAVLGLLATSLVAFVTAAPASAAQCTRVWTGAKSADWDDKDNWSPNTSAPTSDDIACLTGGSFTVDLDSGNNHVVGGIVVGNDTTDHVTLRVARTNNVTLMVTTLLRVGPGSTLHLGGPNSVGASVGPSFGSDPSFVNLGTIVSERVTVNNDPWTSPVNTFSVRGQNDGLISVTGGGLLLGAALTNNGTFRVASNAITQGLWGGDKTFTNNGIVENNGILPVFGGRWHESGTVSGKPVTIRSSATLIDDSSKPGLFELMSSKFSGTVGAKQVLHLHNGDGGGSITFLTPSTIAHGARLIADDLDGNNYTFLGAKVLNHGSIAVSHKVGATSQLLVQTPFENAADGTITLQRSRLIMQSNLVHRGSLAIDATSALWAQASDATFTNYGRITNLGEAIVSSGTWSQQAGSLAGRALVVSDNAALVDAGGTGDIQLQAVQFRGTVPAGQTLHMGGGQGGQALTVTAPSTVAKGGRIVSAIDGNGFALQGKTLTNKGRIELNSVKGESRQLDVHAPLVNAPGGVLAVQTATLMLGSGGTVTNQGTLEFRIASPAAFGAIRTWGEGTRSTLLGTVRAAFAGSYRPAAGTSFAVIQTPYSGRFAASAGGVHPVYSSGAVSLRVAAHASSVTMSAPAAVHRGATATIAATLKDAFAGKVIARQRVTLYRRADSHRPWTKVTTATTSARGTASAKATVSRSAQFVWKWAGSAAHARALSRVAVVKLR